MALTMTNCLPMTLADGITGKNNGRAIRKGLLSSILLPDVKASPLAVRNGVLPHDFDSAGVTSLRVQQQATASTTVDILAGPAVCERLNQGPYIAWLESTGTLPTPTAPDASNPRIDVVYLQAQDKASISTDGNSDGLIDIVYGTPSATPSAPTVFPDGAVLLAQINRPSLATRPSGVIQTSDITDIRKGAGLLGAVRRMLPGDALSDPGKVDGELRYRQAAAPLPSLIDYWDAAQGLWRGTQGFGLTGTFPGTPDSNSNVSAVVSGGGNVLVSIAIPDPGFPYRVKASGLFKINAISSPTSVNSYVSINYGPFAGAIGNSAQVGGVSINPIGKTIFTGASTARLILDVLGGGSVGWGADVRNYLTLDIIPA